MESTIEGKLLPRCAPNLPNSSLILPNFSSGNHIFFSFIPNSNSDLEMNRHPAKIYPNDRVIFYNFHYAE